VNKCQELGGHEWKTASFLLAHVKRPISFFRARNVGPDKPTTWRASQLTARRYRRCARRACPAPVNSSYQVLAVAGWSPACRAARRLHLCWRVRARQPTPSRPRKIALIDSMQASEASLIACEARGAAWGLGAGIVEHEVACSACRSMPGGGPRSDRTGISFCAGKEGARSVERVVKVLGRLLALARDAKDTRPATLWLLACLCFCTGVSL